LVETIPLKNFYRAEDYHQDYLDKNPGGYCHIEPGFLKWQKSKPTSSSQASYQKQDKKF
jgi:peptide methionine sulfoxide reductase msrA/msrB